MRPNVPTGFCTGSSPNTRTVPDCALSIPRTCLMSVVLPAPLPPINPNTPPRGTVSEILSSAVLLPNCRVTRRMSTIGGAAEGNGSCIASLLSAGGLHGRVALLNEFDDLFQREIHVTCLSQQGVDACRENLNPFAAGQRGTLVGNVRSRRAALLHDAGRFQFAVRAGHCVRVDQQPFGQSANRWQLLSRMQPAGGNQIFDLVDDLQVDWHAVVGGNVDLHEDVSATKMAGPGRLACISSIIQVMSGLSSQEATRRVQNHGV